MSQITDDAGEVIVHYYGLFKARYHEHWKPSNEHVGETIDLLRSLMPGIPGYTKEDLLARLDAFFRCKEEWIVSTKHNYSVFVKHIHRWLGTPTQHPAAASSPQQYPSYWCPECGNELLTPSEICEKCFPHCPDCDMQHSQKESCAEFAEREKKIRQMFSKNPPRGNQVVNLAGDPVINNKEVKEIRNAMRNEE